MTNIGTSLVFHGYDGSALMVESATGRITGLWVPGDAAARLDFMTPAELCRCCAQELLASGSRWSTWFCADCRPRVRASNERPGRAVIPIGRHSMMNGLFLSDFSDIAVDAFARAWQPLAAAMDRIHEWTRERVRRNCAALGWPADRIAPLADYLDAIVRAELSRALAFEELLEWWSTSVP